MKFITPSTEFIKEKDALKKIEICGRLCYKSESSEDSSEKFARALIKNGHHAMLEHHSFIFSSQEPLYEFLEAETNSKFFNLSSLSESSFLISGNVRSIRNMFLEDNSILAAHMVVIIGKDYPVLVEDIVDQANRCVNMFKRNSCKKIDLVLQEQENIASLCKPYRDNDKDKLPEIWRFLYKPAKFTEVWDHLYETVKFTTNRGISHEIVRHRIASFAQESSRYCNYAKDKFGKEITFILPPWVDKGLTNISIAGNNTLDFFDIPETDRIWASNCEDSEAKYFSLLEHGWTPEQARDVLNNSTKTEIIMTASLKYWNNFFDLRARDKTGKAHPEMKQITLPLMAKFEEEYPYLIGV